MSKIILRLERDSDLGATVELARDIGEDEQLKVFGETVEAFLIAVGFSERQIEDYWK